MKFDCSHCGQNLEAEPGWGGLSVACPSCGESLVIPKPAAPVHAAQAPAAAQVPRPPSPPRRQPPVPSGNQASGGSGKNRNSGGSPFSKFLFLIAILAMGAYGYAMYRYQESPQQVWQRLVRYIEELTKPTSPSTAPLASATPTPIASATPQGTPTPLPTATPVDPAAWLLQHQNRWPKQVTLLVAADFPISFDGKTAGSAKVPAGAKVSVVQIEPGFITASYGGGTQRLPLEATDILQFAKTEMMKPEPTPRPAPAIAVAAAAPSPILSGSSSADGENDASDATASTLDASSKGFVHPGLLHTEEDFKRMRVKVRSHAEPWFSGWKRLTDNHHSSLAWEPRPQEIVYRGKGSPENYGILYNDIAAAYACALRWRVSGEVAYAQKGVEICNAWGSKLKKLDGSSDRFLAAGIYGYEFANAAEILRTYHGWKAEDFARFQKMMLDVFYSMNHNFLEHHNGAAVDHYWCNWDACNIASTIAIGVLCDKRSIYREGVNYFKFGKGNGSIRHAVVYLHPGHLGQMQESGRDQGHCTLCVSLLGAVCQMAWNQGDDLFGYDNNRFLAGAEYVAKYNLGKEVPFRKYADSSFTTDTISEGGRGTIRPAWELLYNHYVKLKGLSAPYVQQFAEKVRPEGGGGDYGPNSGGYDQLGYGTLTFTRDATTSAAN